jgi:hypothetical protein
MEQLQNPITGFAMGATLGLMTSINTNPRSRRGSLFIDLRTVPICTIVAGIAAGLVVHTVPKELKAPVNITLGLFNVVAGSFTYSML